MARSMQKKMERYKKMVAPDSRLGLSVEEVEEIIMLATEGKHPSVTRNYSTNDILSIILRTYSVGFITGFDKGKRVSKKKTTKEEVSK